MRTGGGESAKIWDSERHKENTKRIETHDDNTDDDYDDDDNNICTSSRKQENIPKYIKVFLIDVRIMHEEFVRSRDWKGAWGSVVVKALRY